MSGGTDGDPAGGSWDLRRGSSAIGVQNSTINDFCINSIHSFWPTSACLSDGASFSAEKINAQHQALLYRLLLYMNICTYHSRNICFHHTILVVIFARGLLTGLSAQVFFFIKIEKRQL